MQAQPIPSTNEHVRHGCICGASAEVIGLPGGMDNQELWPLIEARPMNLA